MRRRSKPAKAKVEAKLSVARKSLKNSGSRVRDLEKCLAEALEQQTATSQILRVISSSPTDVQPVFDAIAASAVTLCEALNGGVFRFDGRLIHLVAHHNWSPDELEAIRHFFPIPPGRGSVTARAILTGAVAYVLDPATDAEFVSGISVQAGLRTTLSVPMLRDGNPIGAITVTQREVKPFSETQIALLQTFAAQAVIAIENVRVFSELQEKNRALTEAHAQVTEALEQLTATSEILRVIASSPTDVQPVFDTIVANAVRLCSAHVGGVERFDGELMHLGAYHNYRPEELEVLRQMYPRPPQPDQASGRAILTRAVVQIEDILADPQYQQEVALAGRWRSILAVPMLRDGVPIGAIVITRSEAGAFSTGHVDLLRTFAAQAVIAIENVRLFNETKEALEQQTATSEILRVISGSPTEVRPVFDTILDNATRLCEAQRGALFLFDGEAYHAAAFRGAASALVEHHTRAPIRPGPHTALARVLQELRPVHIDDVLADAAFGEGDPLRRAVVELEGMRTLLMVPLLKEGRLVGAISVYRREVRPFTDRQIGLMQTFATQAVIAIENVRLFRELEARNRDLTQALDQQTATSEILRVISSAHTEAQPVFDTIVQSAARLCNAATAAVFRVEGGMLYHPANYGGAPEALAAARARYPRPVGRDTGPGQAILSRAPVQIPDIEDPSVPAPVREAGHLLGFRSFVAVPMLSAGEAVGAIVVTRRTPGVFSNGEVELLKTFADQAIIAIENVRLFTELQAKNRALTEAHAQVTEALDQQTATSEILRVISSSPTDLQPVLDAVAASSARLCEAQDAAVIRLGADGCRVVATYGRMSWPGAGEVVPLSRTTPVGRSIIDRRTVHVHDLAARLAEYPDSKAFVERFGTRTVLAAPLLRESEAVGCITIRRQEARPFSDKQIALLQTFADQAVIAIENVRLFTELGEKNQALTAAHAQVTESLERQTATAEILRVISSSPTDLAPVMDTVTRSATRLARADHALIGEVAEGRIRWLATSGCPLVPEGPPISHQLPSGRAILNCQTTQVEDVTELTVEFPGVRRAYEEFGVRTILATPLVREGLAIGVLLVRRTTVRPFTDTEIGLLRTFADQAVIAIENVRLFQELQARNAELTESLEQQSATSEILRVISSSPTDIQPVMEAVAENAARVCGATDSSIYRLEGEYLRVVARHGSLPRSTAIGDTVPVSRDTIGGRVVSDRRTIHVEDFLESEAEFPDTASRRRRAGSLVRTALATPLLREGTPLGVIVISRGPEVHPFSAKQIALLETFANQAVIAIENVRLFQELRARTAELTRSVEQLTALGEVSRAVSSTLDVETVLQTIVTRANELAGTDGCSIFEYDEAAEAFRLRASRYADPREAAALDPIGRATPIPKGQGLAGRAALRREPVHIPDIAVEGAYESPVRAPLLQAGYRALLGVPLLREEQVIGVLTVSRKTPGDFAPEVVRVLMTFATQSALAIQNARLFREIADKSQQLEAASRHKSEFLANMSHELRTPLNAIIGFSEVLAERMFGEVNEKQAEYLQDILASGRHLLSLINDILDLSKVEAGRLELELGRFHLPTALDNALTLVRERATRHGITLDVAVDAGLGEVVGDERKIRQILLNLLSNAVKFTPEGGRVGVTATAADGTVTISVSDTGVGIAPEDQAAIFEEFRQVGRDDARKQEGTGLGLTLAKKFVELHGGHIWVRSQVGQGSTFTFTLPVRPEGTSSGQWSTARL